MSREEEIIEDIVETTTAGLVPPPPSGTFSPFRYPIFRAIWIANLFSNLGSTLQSVGAAWLMTELTPSHQLVALVQASATVPIMLLGMFAGAIADNFDRRRVMLAAQVGMLTVSAALAALAYAGLITPSLLLAFTLSVGAGTALNSPAWQASVRQQVAPAELPQAIALNSISFNIARSIGPALGGLLISIWNVSFAFAINAVSYIGLILVLLWWRPEPRRIERRPILPAVAEGIRYCAGNGPLRRILIRGLALGFSLAAYQSLLPAVVSAQMHGSELAFGLMLGLFGIGSILAAPFIGAIRRKLGLEGILALGAAMFVGSLSLVAEVSQVVYALPAAFAAGMGWVWILTTINTAVQMRSPDDILGRCLSIYQAVTFGGMALGSWAWGALADWKSLPFALHAGSVFLIVSFTILRLVAPLPRPGEGVLRPS
ncbi:MFS transporter [Novosphingobium mangrovi (ex Huang et al. 2023)]|uniref:MFS transporter n=1 Tax=Novosphingobium mangrovi (ex Huang et al. 2023) TaxID=2976432 RepID=A0ABT2I9S1_9SPHN|nr:MFS transporter [Novosphingobium mangrovi (ex Huang et al. 2023)]MCT2401573.1 MFS transporter [Novosphingobium mangrovi (ex Huang et al. 2023)]